MSERPKRGSIWTYVRVYQNASGVILPELELPEKVVPIGSCNEDPEYTLSSIEADGTG